MVLINLINPPHEESLDTKLDPPLGLLYLASVIEQQYEVSITDLNFYPDKAVWETTIPFADIYGITVMTASLHHAIFLKELLKKINPNCKIIVGGAHPTSLPYEMIRYGFDAIIEGEGEGIILEVIHNLIKQKYTKIYRNIIDVDIDLIPIPARYLVPIMDYTRQVAGIKSISVLSSRGCPYKCAFCMNSTKTIKVRFRDPILFLDEITTLIKVYGFKAFNIIDDTFTVHPKLDIILDKISKLGIIFRCNGNARLDTKNTFDKLYLAGCREISFGIESGSQKVLDLVNKKVTVKENKRAILSAKESGLMVRAYLMVGSPGESWNTIHETIDFMNETQPNLWTVFNFVPLPGCEIWINPLKYGIKIITHDYKQYYTIAGYNRGGITIETKEMTANDIIKARQYILNNLPTQTGKLQNYYIKLDKTNDN